MIQDKWKVFAMQQCFSNEMTDAECIVHFNALDLHDYPDDVEKYLFDSNLIPWHPYEYMHAGEFIEHVLNLALQAQTTEGTPPEPSSVSIAWLVGGWQVSTTHDGQYLYIGRDGAPGQIHIKAEDEGFVVDLWDETLENCVGSAAATYSELEPE